MAYVKQNFVKGQILTAEHMNHIEDGIVAAADAQSLGGVAAGSYALKTDVAPDSTMLGGKAPAYYLQPRNLLDNSNFSNPVAQAGLNGAHGSAVYVADRWIANACTAAKSQGCLNITTTKAYAHIWQKVTGVAGKTLTCAGKFSGAGVGAIRIYDENISTMYAELKNIYVVGCVTFTVPNDVDTISVLLYPNQLNVASGLIYWAALYEGSYTANTLPPYVPKGYAAELAECQRYYQKYNTVGLTCRNNGYATALLPVVMRVTPTISVETRLLFTSSYTDVAADYPSVNLQADSNLIYFTNNFYTGFATLTCSNVQLSADL